MSTSNRTVHCGLLAACLALLAAPFLFGAAASAQSMGYSYGNSSIGQAINSTYSYIGTVNQSSYLFFYPNLTGAYNYISLARNESQINLTYAYLLLGKARASATLQQQLMLKYQQLSLSVLAALSVLLAAILYFFMRPVRQQAGPHRGGRGK